MTSVCSTLHVNSKKKPRYAAHDMDNFYVNFDEITVKLFIFD